MKPSIEPLNEKEKSWVKAQLESASSFVEGFSPNNAGKPLTLAALDRAFAAWITSHSTDIDTINSVINYVSIAFGQALVDGIGLHWVIAIDEHSSDLAVQGLPEHGDVLVYPANLVAKRWEKRERYFLENAYQQIAKDVRAAFRQSLR